MTVIYLHRRAVLKKWKKKQGVHATYNNLLRQCCLGGDAHTAAAICEVLRKERGIPILIILHVISVTHKISCQLASYSKNDGDDIGRGALINQG